MDYFDDFLGNIKPPTPAPKAEVVKKVHTKAAVVVEEKRRIDELMEGIAEELTPQVMSVLSYNYSTSSVNENRPVPTREQKIRALWDYWAFTDLINFHGGSLAFSECHREMVSFKLNSKSFRQLVLEARGHLKAQSVETPILTKDGWKTFGTLDVGDYVPCPGGWTAVTALHPISSMKLYRVTFSDGRSTLCNEEHLWAVGVQGNRGRLRTLPLSSLIKDYQNKRFDARYQTNQKSSRYYIELSPVEYPNKRLPIDPYTLGMWLGDGHSAGARMTSADPEIFNYSSYDWKKNTAEYGYSATFQSLQEDLRELGVLNNKHIPESYFSTSVSQRYKLLRGLMDTDGTPGACGNLPSFTTSRDVLKDDFVRLVQSLGGQARANWVDSVSAWYISCITPECCFNLRRKANAWKPSVKAARLYITNIEYETTDLGRCISVSSPDGLYLTDTSFITTHNSTLLCVGYVLWRIYQNPNIRIFVGTESLKLSKAFIREIEQYLVDDFNRENVWNARPHIDGPLIPEMDSLGKQRRAIIRDISSEFGEEYSTGSNASTSKKVWRAEAIQVVRTRTLKEPTITAGSVGQTSTGFHFDEVLFDDVHTYDNCSSETKIAKVYSWIFDIESVLDPPYVDIDLVNSLHSVAPQQFSLLRKWAISGGRMTVIGTRYDDADYYGHIIENNDKLGFDVHVRNVFKNGVDETDGFRWPEKWNTSVLESTKANFVVKHGSTGLQRFYSQYYNRIVNLEDAILNWNKVNFIGAQYVKLEEDGWVSIFNSDATLKAQFKPRLVMDPTSTAGKRSDFCAICVGGVYEGQLYVVDFWMKKEKPEVYLKQMYDMVNKWNLHEVVVEMVGGFKVLEFTITQMWLNDPDKYRPLAVKTYEGGTQGDAKIQRIETTLSPLVHNEMLWLPLSCSRMDDLKKQFLFFGKETAKDDGPDVLSILKEVAYTRFERPKSSGNRRGQLVAKINSRWGGVEYTVA